MLAGEIGDQSRVPAEQELDSRIMGWQQALAQGKEGLLFVNKKKQKNFINSLPLAYTSLSLVAS